MTDETKHDEYEYTIVLRDITYESLMLTHVVLNDGCWKFFNRNNGACLVVKDSEFRYYLVTPPTGDPDRSGDEA